MAPRDKTQTSDPAPFGAMEPPSKPRRTTRKPRSDGPAPDGAAGGSKSKPEPEARNGGGPAGGADRRDGGDGGGDGGEDKRRSGTRRGGRRRRKRKPQGDESPGGEPQGAGSGTQEAPPRDGRDSRESREGGEGTGRRRRRRRSKNKGGDGGGSQQGGGQQGGGQQSSQQGGSQGGGKTTGTASGMFIAETGGFGTLRSLERQWIPSKQDIFVPQRLIQKFKLRDGSIVEGPTGKGKKYKLQLENVTKIDGEDPKHFANLRSFKSLTTIDPDFHYEVGDVTGDVTMRVLDILAPIGRGQRGLITAAPRTGKTSLLREFAKGIEVGYPEVHLMVLLVDERPEEATDWQRSTGGQVFVSTSDETPKNHVRLAEAVWKRCQRMVELGQDVVLILDSITRLARAYNNNSGGSGRTMSGGLDSRAMERPRQIFGSARNTETAGSLTILGTALIDTGSRMDQMIFEEFKGTGNMEVVLNRKLADRRIFPAIDIEKTGTRKEEKIISSRRLKRINTLRRVLLRMNFIEAMELLTEKLLDVEKTDDFLQRFEIDPEA